MSRLRYLRALAFAAVLLASAASIVLILRDDTPPPLDGTHAAREVSVTREPPRLKPIPKVSRVDELLAEVARLRSKPTVSNNRRRARAIGALGRVHEEAAERALRDLAMNTRGDPFERCCAINAWWVDGERSELLSLADASPSDLVLTKKVRALKGAQQRKAR